MTIGEKLDVTLLQAVYGGECLARLPDGRTLFVAYGLPGETVRVEVTEEKRSFVRARLLEVLTPSPQRISPLCPHFGDCGGCQYQDMPYELQLKIKEAVVGEQLKRIAGIEHPPLQPIIPAPAEWAYRNSIQFHLDAAGKVGFQGLQSHRVTPVQVCYLPEEGLNEIWPRFDFEPSSGLERVEFRLGSDGEPLVVLEGDATHLPEVEVEMSLSLVHLSPAGQVVLSGNDYFELMVLDKPFLVSAPSFFQVNSAQAGAMVSYLLKQLPLTPESTWLDVYCGVGLFSAFVAERVKECIGIELSPSACRDYAVNLDAFDNVSLYEGAAEAVLPALDVKADGVILDPPRAGLDPRALDALVAAAPEMIAYVSCDPATLARDLKRLIKAGYRLETVQPFDMFPQTYHVECVALMTKI